MSRVGREKLSLCSLLGVFAPLGRKRFQEKLGVWNIPVSGAALMPSGEPSWPKHVPVHPGWLWGMTAVAAGCCWLLLGSPGPACSLGGWDLRISRAEGRPWLRRL